jgi:hypothetical protein
MNLWACWKNLVITSESVLINCLTDTTDKLLHVICTFVEDFIKLFLQKVGDLCDEDKTCGACQEAYNLTLANFHPWFVRKGAIVAMYALPTRAGLLQKVCSDTGLFKKYSYMFIVWNIWRPSVTVRS